MKLCFSLLILAISISISAQNSLPKVASGKLVRIENFQSKYVTQRNIDIWIPNGYDGKKKFAVLYMHDGQALYDSTTTWNHQAWDVDDVAGKLIAKGKLKNFIVVGIWNGGATRHPDYFPQKPFEQLTQTEKDTVTAQLHAAGRTKEIFKPQSDNYLKFIVNELKPYIDTTFSVYPNQENTFIAGSSMGGLISMYAICEYPDVFGGAACFSTHWVGTFTLKNNPVPNAFINYMKKNLPSPANHKIYFDCGDQTLDALYPAIQNEVDELMVSKGYSEKNWMTVYAKGEDHSERAWNKRLHIPIQFLLSKDKLSFENNTNSEKFYSLSFGSIKPNGWLKEQMQHDLEGFVGNLDQVVPELINDPIYSSGRLGKHSKAKDLGNMKEGDAAGDDQYKWWNSETQSNWWDGYLRNIILLDDKNGIEKVKKYVESILATQDDDGYIGIYDKELRYKFNSENGELWSKATLFRGLLAYFEYTKDEKVLKAVEKAVSNVMENYPINASSPFNSGTGFNGGVSHGLTFTDVLERLYYLTQEEKYRDYALFLYNDFSNTYQSEADAQLKNILNPDYKLKSHGVHTYEHIRALIIAKYASDNEQLNNALDIYLERIKNVTTISGGAIGDEWIAERSADETNTGYEYCSLQELLDSYCLLMQKRGHAETGDRIENIFYNAAQGSRNPKHSCIAYLKTDNSYEMLGTKNGEVEPDRKQTRYKYSPAHQDVAVCCNPNAGRISPYFIQNSWMKKNATTIVATLLMPNIMETTLCGKKMQIENVTQYPYENNFKFIITQSNPSDFILKIRKPAWVKNIKTNEKYRMDDDFIVIEREFSTVDSINISFETEVQIKTDNAGAHYFTYGALLYALPIQAKEIAGKNYISNLTDFTYEPVSPVKYSFKEGVRANYKNGKILTKLINQNTGKLERVELVPLGNTILRQVSFM